MSEPQPQSLMIKDGNEILEIAIYTNNPVDFQPTEPPEMGNEDDEYVAKSATSNQAIASLEKVHEYIQLYVKYAIGAFKNFTEAEIEEVNLKFGIKIAGKAGIPMVTEGSTDANFEIQVKCKFPTQS